MPEIVHIPDPAPQHLRARPRTQPTVLTVAGSDSSGGAGIEADIKTITMHGCYAMTCISAITAQTPRAVDAVRATPAPLLAAVLRGLFRDMAVDAIKTGMLTPAAVDCLLAALRDHRFAGPLVVDPVMAASSGSPLTDLAGPAARALLRRAALVTPNVPEACRLLAAQPPASPDGLVSLAQALARDLSTAVLLKGGHCPYPPDAVLDVLVDPADPAGPVTFCARRLSTPHTHGTGCTLAAAIAANLSRAMSLREAVYRGIIFVHHAIALQPERSVCALPENGPVHHAYALNLSSPATAPEASRKATCPDTATPTPPL
ncbi:AER226Wp [Eremothecium gossypii ATCC 10895]|uniref:AER226Wp n=1 Tax=Eremothecium gossypii (strain ATCC 10895 / CBS 109.51 / FGSC 9923 / NRRL Y-1056) TaxID=284811 RepID=Q756M8_EREGS|nr:AER226Wp [Eremothecium gossypii ATCC 10895]AAS52907.2 AER226Wp [Eremothecium gossypii ATCC 10895]AEY97215.1 FAER226Wp [Eremothecium gossypii FDAG1]